ncbi:MAG: hypothetical protein CMH22_02540 [Methylophaga sp.]|uniref:hypothetical protein n=2 Tax=Methylophaga TaxID=40222 RepID=UPI000C47AD1B|nr:hypothetical protein [Methylophaga sp. UBA678]MAX50841.1 hypothetical protein [Methylophaga sp.]
MMKNFKLKLALLSSLSCLASTQAMAAWENLPAAGVSVGSDTSAYILCNPTGDFGSGSGADAPVQPSSTADECAVMPINEALPPDSSFTGASRIPVVNGTRTITMNNSYTNNTNVVIGNVKEYVWRNSSTNMCIYGMRVSLTNTDYNLTEPGKQTFEVNDIARKGWSGKTIDVAYSTVPTTASPIYRIGRTFTSVQHRPGFVDQPITGLGSSPAINGVNVWPTPAGRPTAAEQKADIDTDWVDFTTDANYLDDDGSTNPLSGMSYVRSSCTSGTFTTAADAIRLRQTFQELSADGSTDNPFIEVEVEGVIPN